MAAGGQLPVMRAVGMAYRDVYRAYRAMPLLLLIALAITLALGFLQVYLIKWVLQLPLVGPLASLLVGAVQSVFLTPVLIAIHRFILIDEVTPRYELALQSARFQRFFAWSVALLALNTATSLIVELLVLAGLSFWVTGTLQSVLIILTLFISLRLTILFPAIAVDAPGADASKAFADTKGHALGIFLIMLVALLPLIVIVIVVAFATMPATGDAGVTIVAQVLVGLLLMPLFVAIASRIFQALADQVLARDAAGAPAVG
jgi:hypothetical protein